MCGITGFVDFSKKSTLEQLVQMTRVIVHRGPDDVGTELFETNTCKLGLGFRRLAIIDLSPSGHQPMQNPDTKSWIVFNGEIYNFQEIKRELESLQHRFVSHSDTEVILKAYQQWGLSCVDKFIGMFAIALYDQQKEKLILIRDRAGVKPLYYYWDDTRLLFASELKCFHEHGDFKKEIDPEALSAFFQFGYVPAPLSIFKNASKLLPGHILEIDLKSKQIQLRKYWDAANAYLQPKLEISFNEAVKSTEDLLLSAFQYRMIADVPVGVFLSGGYDSSCVTAILQKNSTSKIKTFTIGFEDEKYNEATHARKVADYLGTDHHEHICTFKEAMEIVPQLPEIYDEPFGDSSAVPTTLVSHAARKHVTVALSADGGDELFAGYPRHLKSLSYLSKRNTIPKSISSLLGKLIPNQIPSFTQGDQRSKLKAILLQSDTVNQFKIINHTFSDNEVKYLLTQSLASLIRNDFDNDFSKHKLDLLSGILLTEYKTYLCDDILQKVDRATMSTSLEGREPFLDHRILELIAKMPSEYKLKGMNQKILLKAIVHKYIPESIMDRPKMGFGIPLKDWMNNTLKDLFMSSMNDQALAQSGLIHINSAKKIRDAYLNGEQINFEKVWFLFIFQQWYQRWIANN